MAGQETESWPGYTIDTSFWDDCFIPWTNPPPGECIAPANGVAAGYVPFLAQIFIDRPREDFEARFQRLELFEMQHVCGGTLIKPLWVLTAAHCITKEQPSKGYKVRLGVNEISNPSEGVVFEIEDVIHHPKYRKPRRSGVTKEHDIALLRLKPRNSGRRIQNPDSLPNVMPLWDDSLRPPYPIKYANWARPSKTPASRIPWGLENLDVYGWGKTIDIEGEAPASVTYTVQLTALQNEFCARLTGFGAESVNDGIFCAVDPIRKTCRGDSGGPVLDAMGFVIGIVSWGKSRCRDDGQPGVYTRIAFYHEWIDSVISDDPSSVSERAQ